jgi:hypothetical protein
MKNFLLAVAVLSCLHAQNVVHARTGPGLQAGAAKIDISPETRELRPGDRIRDPLFVRAIVIRNDTDCAVLVGADQVGIGNQIIQSATSRIGQAVGCPPSNILISATHTHSGSTHGIESGGAPSEKRVENAIVDAVAQAAKRLRSARIGFGTTHVYLNTNRDLFTDNRWMQGPNPQGPSDKTVAIIEVLDTNDQPIGVYMNYAMHPISFYLSGVVSADVPGEASRYIERRYAQEMVAIFAQGAAGDQNPLLTRPLYELVAGRTGSPTAANGRLNGPAPWVEMARESDANSRLTDALKAPVPAAGIAAYEAAIANQSELVSGMGAILGESVLDAMRYDIRRLSGEVIIGGASASFQCPGRDRTDSDRPVREGSLPTYVDGLPVTLTEGVLRLGDIHIVYVNGEVYSEIAARLKREAPASQLMMTTLANGMANSGYIYSNAAGSHLTFQVIGSRLQPGCAEDRIVGTALQLISKVGESPPGHEVVR